MRRRGTESGVKGKEERREQQQLLLASLRHETLLFFCSKKQYEFLCFVETCGNSTFVLRPSARLPSPSVVCPSTDWIQNLKINNESKKSLKRFIPVHISPQQQQQYYFYNVHKLEYSYSLSTSRNSAIVAYLLIQWQYPRHCVSRQARLQLGAHYSLRRPPKGYLKVHCHRQRHPLNCIALPPPLSVLLLPRRQDMTIRHHHHYSFVFPLWWQRRLPPWWPTTLAKESPWASGIKQIV